MKKTLLILILLFVGISSSFAQNTLNGTVEDKEGNPIPGVKVRARGQDGFVISNLDGTFHVDSRKPVKNVKLTYPGFKEEKYKVHSNMVVKMKRTNWWTEKPGIQFFIGPQMGLMLDYDSKLGKTKSGKYYPSVGFMMGCGGIVKVYTKFHTNMFYKYSADFRFLPLGFVHDNFGYPADNTGQYDYDYDEITSTVDFSLGGMIRLKCPIYLYAGVVYEWHGDFYDVNGNIFWDDMIDNYNFTCIAEVGLMMTFKKVFINAGAIIGEGAQLHCGIGIMLP